VPISAANPFKGRQYPGDVILTAVRWYLRYPLAYEHVSELLAERGLPVDASCVEGEGFDSRAIANPTDPQKRLLPNGRGIYLMRALMDDVCFEENGKVVHMRKRLTRRLR
jgi:hypothetical protein